MTEEHRKRYDRDRKAWVDKVCDNKPSHTTYTPPDELQLAREFVPSRCITFGCGKPLTPQESLFGNKCINCQNTRRTDVGKWVSI